MPDRICSIDGCERKHFGRGWCQSHYQSWWNRNRDVTGRVCSVDGCDRSCATRGWCSMHYQRWTDHGDLNHVRKPHVFVFPPCSVEGCERSATTRALGPMHYQRWRNTGSVTLQERPTTEERFWAFVAKGGPDDCWPWIGHVGEFGYGAWGHGWRESLRKGTAHRFAYEFSVGPVPDGLHVDHICHNRDGSCVGGPGCVHRRCCNPSHLEAVSQAENNRRAARHRMQGRLPKRKRKPGVMV